MPGQSDAAYAEYVINCIKTAVQLCMTHQVHAMVTGPVNKAVINNGGIIFSGHTEYIAKMTQTQQPIMMMVGGETKVALATWHIPLRDVPDTITRRYLTKVISTTHQDMVQKFHIIHPRIAVCGLNPHAGEKGYLGQEELETITPVIERLKAEGVRYRGGHCQRTVCFLSMSVVIMMLLLRYIMIKVWRPLKHYIFKDAVNITLGLPIIRTSVDHGTAFDLAGTGQADATSLQTAIEWAARLSGTTDTKSNVIMAQCYLVLMSIFSCYCILTLFHILTGYYHVT